MNQTSHGTDKSSPQISEHASSNSHQNIVEVDEMLKDLIPDFMNRRNQELQDLDTWSESSNFTALAQYGHKLKGSSLNYGFNHLGGLAAHLELAARSENQQEIQDLIKEIKEHIRNIQVVFVSE